jgi:hypothetical protein
LHSKESSGRVEIHGQIFLSTNRFIMDAKEDLTKGRINNISLGIALLLCIGLFFYGLINNIQAQKEKEIAQEETKKALACEKHSLLLTEQLQEKEKQLTQARAEAALLKEQTLEK